MGVIGFEYFKTRIVSKLKQVNSDIIDTHIYSAQSSERYYIDYRPTYPEVNAADFTVCQNIATGKVYMYSNMGALIPTIREFDSIEDFEHNLVGE